MGEIVVTGSRITITGYTQPTPVTVVGLEKLRRDNLLDLASVIDQLPAAGPGSSPNSANGSQSVSAGTAGLSFINLRGLGTTRTLVLFDGLRVTPSTPSGGTDLNLLPSSLVDRIDIVTGGASAAWGSDAVAGVVNVVLNKKFTGLLVNVEGATNDLETRNSGKVEVSFGRDFADGRGHVILAGSYLDSPDVVTPQMTPWYHAQNLILNPAYTATNGQPQYIHASNVGLAFETQGGVITTGPLAGTQFLANGTPAPFVQGAVTGLYQNGGTFVSPPLAGQTDDLAVPIAATTLFGHISYDLTPNIQLSFELNYGHSTTENGSASYTRLNNVSIGIDNPYLDPSIVARMQAAGVNSFLLGTTNVNGAGPTFLGPGGLGDLNDRVSRTLFRQVAVLNGEVSGWKFNVSLQHSTVENDTHLVVDPVIGNYNLAVDAVRVTSANVGASGLPIGSIACRSTLTAPTNGCAPLDILGTGVASPAAIAYVNDGAAASNLLLEQYTAGANVQGQPFSLWAGPVAVVGGVEYRRESVLQTADALSYARGYAAGNFQYFNAHDSDYEFFAETDVPLLKDRIVKSVDFNAAGRYTNYSYSGGVETWKLGLTSQINDSIRVRGTISADIRAPTLQDLYNPNNSSIQTIADPTRGNAPTNIYAIVAGNPDLKPEKAKTKTVGIVLTPRFIPGLQASVDWYSIDIHDAISSPAFQFVLAQCVAGVQLYCPFVQRNAAGVLTSIIVSPVNASSQTTSGYDFQLDYHHELGRGAISASVIGNYTDHLTLNQLGTTIQEAGSLNYASPIPGAVGFPKLHATAAVTYSQDRFSGTVQFRGYGTAKLSDEYGSSGPNSVDNNNVPAVGYWDLRASYYLGKQRSIQVYGAIDNLFSINPPNIPQGPTAPTPYFYLPTRTDIYDALGRVYRFGFRAKF